MPVSRNRLLLLAVAVAAAAAVVVALLLVGAGTDSKRTATVPSPSSAQHRTTSALAGVPQRGDTLGKTSAPVSLLVFEDPQCPFCRQWNTETLPTVVERYVRTGRVKLVFRGIEIIGPNSVQGLRAIYAAGRQDKLWKMVDEIYRLQGAENSGWITDSVIRAAARASGADATAILASSSSAAVDAALAQAASEATADGVRGTPTFIVQRPPGLPQQLSVAALDPASFTAALDAALQ